MTWSIPMLADGVFLCVSFSTTVLNPLQLRIRFVLSTVHLLLKKRYQIVKKLTTIYTIIRSSTVSKAHTAEYYPGEVPVLLTE